MVARGEVVTFFGALYRLIGLDDDSVLFERLDEEELTKRYAAMPDSRVFTHARPELGDDTRLRGVNVMAIEALDGTDAEEFVATIKLVTDEIDPKTKVSSPVEKSLNVRVGDEFRAERNLGGLAYCLYTVRTIVPPDEKNRIVGWVECKETEVTKEDAKKEQGTRAEEME